MQLHAATKTACLSVAPPSALTHRGVSEVNNARMGAMEEQVKKVRARRIAARPRSHCVTHPV